MAGLFFPNELKTNNLYTEAKNLMRVRMQTECDAVSFHFKLQLMLLCCHAAF